MKTSCGLVALITLLLVCFFSGDCSAQETRSSEEQSWVGLTKQVYIIGVWQPYLKTVNSCLNFRKTTTPGLFGVWPEDAGDFCCEDRLTPNAANYATIASYVHSEHNGRFLYPIPYYDVGIVAAFTPYWRSWRPDRVSQKDITNVVYCEVNDLKRFYVHRFWREAFAKQGLLYSAIPSILLVELLVLGISQWSFSPALIRASFPRFLGWETAWDLIHLGFLAVNGSLLMEAVGHSDPCGWEAVLLYNNAVIYTYLTLVSFVAAVLQQVALWSRASTNERLHPGTKVKRYRIEKEWQLQRMSAQGAVFFVAALYCTFVTVYSVDDFVAWLLGIIIIAQVWSASVALVMLAKAVKLGRKCWHKRRMADKQERELELARDAPREMTSIVAVPDERLPDASLRARPASSLVERSRSIG
jgi:hypothetical protein